jgi:hypothetical protein
VKRKESEGSQRASSALEEDARFVSDSVPMARELLHAQLVPRYFARIDEDLYVREPDPDYWRPVGRSDVQITPGSLAQALFG